MEDYKRWVDENIRLIILKDLVDPKLEGSTNTFLLQKRLECFNYFKSRDYLRNQLLWLEREVGAVKTRDEGTETSAVITRAGRDHVERRNYLVGVQHPGDPE